jgi:hypothetical protein
VFETDLRFLQRASLLLELLVRDTKLFALNLQFFGLPLSLLKEALEFCTIAR